MERFYLNTVFTLGAVVDVPNEIVRHMHVLRIKPGEIVELFDGNNNSCHSEIIQMDKRMAKLKIIRINPKVPVPSVKISLAIALVANDKMDLIIQKAVELGAVNIIPLYSERSARLPNDRMANKLIHWQNIIISSCCQCRQNQLATIALPTTLTSLYANPEEYNLKIIMHPYPAINLPGWSADDLYSTPFAENISHNAILLVGPEGGFTDMETELAFRNNYLPLQLGNLIMRAETAVIAGLSTLNLCLRQWSINGNFIL